MTLSATPSLNDLRIEINNATSIDPSATVDPRYTTNTISLNDGYVRNLLAGTGTITYGASISMSSFANFTHNTTFIRHFAAVPTYWHVSGYGASFPGLQNHMFKFFPTYDSSHRSSSASYIMAYGFDWMYVATTTSTTSWMFGHNTSNYGVGAFNRSMYTWTTKATVASFGLAAIVDVNNGWCGNGNATMAYLCGGEGTGYVSTSLTKKFVYATLVVSAGPTLVQACSYGASTGNATVCAVHGGRNGSYTTFATTKIITYATNVGTTGTAITTARWGSAASSSPSVGYIYSGFTSAGVVITTTIKYTFTGNTVTYGSVTNQQTTEYLSAGGTTTMAYLFLGGTGGSPANTSYQAKKYTYASDVYSATTTSTTNPAYGRVAGLYNSFVDPSTVNTYPFSMTPCNAGSNVPGGGF